MCRFYSGYFFRHPLLQGYEYYWRVEPDVFFHCTIDEDPFRIMKQNDYKYGYTIMMPEEMPTVRSLWSTSLEWAKTKRDPKLRNQMPLLDYFYDPKKKGYNGCHFWSNFEIARTDLFNNQDYIDYFNHLDSSGGFFYERWGDAPIHSLYVAFTLRKDQVHHFPNIGYSHGGITSCNQNNLNCQCNKQDYNTTICGDMFPSYVEKPWTL
ncbi:YOR099Wp-like protein [Gorgonomyces haynaldii]|nr:YOR099Wp-like protein [Gorgonomyces haynaldii]